MSAFIACVEAMEENRRRDLADFAKAVRYAYHASDKDFQAFIENETPGKSAVGDPAELLKRRGKY